ncbi:hypothetical protein GN956_G20877 [Arapaima gigas]
MYTLGAGASFTIQIHCRFSAFAARAAGPALIRALGGALLQRGRDIAPEARAPFWRHHEERYLGYDQQCFIQKWSQYE